MKKRPELGHFLKTVWLNLHQYKRKDLTLISFLKNNMMWNCKIGPFTASFSLSSSFRKHWMIVQCKLPMTGFEPGSSGFGCTCAVNCAMWPLPKLKLLFEQISLDVIFWLMEASLPWRFCNPNKGGRSNSTWRLQLTPTYLPTYLGR